MRSWLEDLAFKRPYRFAVLLGAIFFVSQLGSRLAMGESLAHSAAISSLIGLAFGVLHAAAVWWRLRSGVPVSWRPGKMRRMERQRRLDELLAFAQTLSASGKQGLRS